jgi:hypothetical protein
MTQQILQFVAVTSGGRAFDIEFPLHPETGSAASVSDLMTGLLAEISRFAQASGDLSDGDILQALAMTNAIRGRMIDADAGQIEALNRSLAASAWQAVQSAPNYAAARA